MGKAEYSSAVRSREYIREALVRLLQEKELDAIAVTELAAVAGVNRSTFYAHYSGVRDVLSQIEQGLVDELDTLLTNVDERVLRENPRELMISIGLFVARDRDMYRRLIAANGATVFLEKLRGRFVSRLSDSTHHRLPPRFESLVCSGIMGVYQDWVTDDHPEPISVVADQLAEWVGVLIKADGGQRVGSSVSEAARRSRRARLVPPG